MIATWGKKQRAPDDFLRGRDGDHTMVPSECDLCVFHKLRNRSPDPNSQPDKLLQACIRRIILDAFWSQATATVGFFSHLRHSVLHCLSAWLWRFLVGPSLTESEVQLWWWAVYCDCSTWQNKGRIRWLRSLASVCTYNIIGSGGKSIVGMLNGIQKRSWLHFRTRQLWHSWKGVLAPGNEWCSIGVVGRAFRFTSRTLPSFNFKQRNLETEGAGLSNVEKNVRQWAIKKKVGRTDIDVVNRWKSVKSADGNRQSHPMRQHYAELELLAGPFLWYTWAM
jgi:hypothetical protein